MTEISIRTVDGGYEAVSEKWPDCRGRGATPEVARKNLKKAVEMMIERFERVGESPPGPKSLES